MSVGDGESASVEGEGGKEGARYGHHAQVNINRAGGGIRHRYVFSYDSSRFDAVEESHGCNDLIVFIIIKTGKWIMEMESSQQRRLLCVTIGGVVHPCRKIVT